MESNNDNLPEEREELEKIKFISDVFAETCKEVIARDGHFSEELWFNLDTSFEKHSLENSFIILVGELSTVWNIENVAGLRIVLSKIQELRPDLQIILKEDLRKRTLNYSVTILDNISILHQDKKRAEQVQEARDVHLAYNTIARHHGWHTMYNDSISVTKILREIEVVSGIPTDQAKVRRAAFTFMSTAQKVEYKELVELEKKLGRHLTDDELTEFLKRRRELVERGKL